MMLDLLVERSAFWYISHIGIVFEIVGALVIVWTAFRTRIKIQGIQDNWDSGLSERLRDMISNQAYVELAGFGLLAFGLLLQMLGGFGP